MKDKEREKFLKHLKETHWNTNEVPKFDGAIYLIATDPEHIYCGEYNKDKNVFYDQDVIVHYDNVKYWILIDKPRDIK